MKTFERMHWMKSIGRKRRKPSMEIHLVLRFNKMKKEKHVQTVSNLLIVVPTCDRRSNAINFNLSVIFQSLWLHFSVARGYRVQSPVIHCTNQSHRGWESTLARTVCCASSSLLVHFTQFLLSAKESATTRHDFTTKSQPFHFQLGSGVVSMCALC